MKLWKILLLWSKMFFMNFKSVVVCFALHVIKVPVSCLAFLILGSRDLSLFLLNGCNSRIFLYYLYFDVLAVRSVLFRDALTVTISRIGRWQPCIYATKKIKLHFFRMLRMEKYYSHHWFNDCLHCLHYIATCDVAKLHSFFVLGSGK